MESILEFENITRRFGSALAVDNVSLSIRKGEVFGLLGPSGCGKTTLLRLAAGFDQPNSGRILLNGRDVTAVPPDKRPVNTVFQNYALFPHLSVWENIAFGLRIEKRPRAEIAAEVARMLALVQMEEHAHKSPTQISGGQKQRVAIARALVKKPDVLLLDEPLAALDLKLRQRMLVELNQIHEEVGTTFIIVTHDQGEAMSLSNRIAVMNQGRIEQLGTPHEIYANPRTAFVASFIGDTNLLEGTVMATDGEGMCEVNVTGLGALRLRSSRAHPMVAAALVSVRPEKITISAERPGGDAGSLATWRSRIEDVIYLGSESRYGTTLAGHKVWAVWQHGRDHAPFLIQKGQEMWLSFSADDALVI